MEQIKAFIEKAKTDSELMAKLDTLGAKGADAEEVIALAAEYGFTFTAQDYEQAKANPAKTGELSETDLDAVSGGLSENRYDASVCRGLSEARPQCKGLFTVIWCDHYREREPAWDDIFIHCEHECAMGCFKYSSKKFRKGGLNP